MMGTELTTSRITEIGATACLHCGNPVPSERRGTGFCCGGCEAVFALLQNRGWSAYYRMKKTGGNLRPSVPVAAAPLTSGFEFLDTIEAERSPDGSRIQRFYLEGVHCAACVWLTEKAASGVPGVESARLNLADSIATVRLRPEEGSFAQVARELSRVGYRPHPVQKGKDEDAREAENRRLLLRLAIAAAVTGNIMLFAVPLYAGIDGFWKEAFRWMSGALCLPVLWYSAWPFYRNAWGSLRHREASIDLPIALGTILAGAISYYNLAIGAEHIYFDSIASLVFLMLSTRYLLKRVQSSALRSANVVHQLAPQTAIRLDADGSRSDVPVESLKPGDRVEVRAGAPIPVDGRVLSGRSHLNCAWLTGESRREAISEGMEAFAGSVNESSLLILEVSASGAETRLARVLREMEEARERKAPIVAYADRVSKLFVWGVLIVCAACLALVWRDGWHLTLNRILSLAVVSCPCAFALATPLAVSLAVSRAAKRGILVKGGDAIERLASARAIFLDKTGTLTLGEPRLFHWENFDGIEGEASRRRMASVVAIESRSNHPIARALVEGLRDRAQAPLLLPEVKDFEEIIGQGVRALVDGLEVRIGTSGVESNHASVVDITVDGRVVARAWIGDLIRPDAKASVEGLRAEGLETWILSGDQRASVDEVATRVGIPPGRRVWRATPEDKARVVRSIEGAVMVGDGANDSVALAAASVGVAVHGGMEASLRAADVYSGAPGVAPLVELRVISTETMILIRRCFRFSLIYNAIGGAAALSGWLSPLFAAVLMPISAATVIASVMIGTRRLRSLPAPGRRIA